MEYRGGNVLGLLFLTDVELLASGLALGEGIAGDTVSLHCPGLQIGLLLTRPQIQ